MSNIVNPGDIDTSSTIVNQGNFREVCINSKGYIFYVTQGSDFKRTSTGDSAPDSLDTDGGSQIFGSQYKLNCVYADINNAYKCQTGFMNGSMSRSFEVEVVLDTKQSIFNPIYMDNNDNLYLTCCTNTSNNKIVGRPGFGYGCGSYPSTLGWDDNTGGGCFRLVVFIPPHVPKMLNIKICHMLTKLLKLIRVNFRLVCLICVMPQIKQYPRVMDLLKYCLTYLVSRPLIVEILKVWMD